MVSRDGLPEKALRLRLAPREALAPLSASGSVPASEPTRLSAAAAPPAANLDEDRTPLGRSSADSSLRRRRGWFGPMSDRSDPRWCREHGAARGVARPCLGERRLTALFDANPVPALLWRTDGPRDLRLVRANAAAERLTRGGLARLRGRCYSEILPRDPGYLDVALAVLERGERQWIETHHRFVTTGETRWLRLQFDPLGHDLLLLHCEEPPRQPPASLRDQGRGVASAGGHDEGELRAEEQARQGVEALASLGQIVAGVAHEVRNPIFGISATIDALELSNRDREDLAPAFQILREQLQRLQTLTQELLEYGRPHLPQPRPTTGAELIELAVASLRATWPRVDEVRRRIAPEAPVANIDPDRGLILVRNLLDNALHHASRPDRVEVVFQRAGDGVGLELLVEDDGPGFPAAELEQVFDPFFSRRSGGTGLGLSLVRRVVEEHRGRVTAENRAEGGGRVRVWLPSVAR
jgi:signal transduction histidine kinase